MKRFRIGVFLWTVCMVCLLTMPSCAAAEAEPLSARAGGFSDVPAQAWYAESVAWCAENEIMTGTSATTFAPERTLTRAQLATILYRMSGSPAVSGAPAFTDAAAGTWYSNAVVWATERGVMTGYGSNRFGVNDPTTREQAVTILWRYAGTPSGTAQTGFSDSSTIAVWAQDAVRWAAQNEMLTGMTTDGRLTPKAPIKRGEVASMLHHYAARQQQTTDGKTLVAYFSATGTTRAVAEQAAEILNTDLYEIVPEVPYTDADLAYYTNGRADREQNDASARPAISGGVENMAQYDVVLLGYPIWHGQPPRIISTFLESYDFSGKTIVPFCTSHSSGYSDSGLQALTSGADWRTGRRFAAGASRSTVAEWLDSLDLPTSAPMSARPVFNFETRRVMLNSGYEMPINGLGTYSLHGEECINSVKSALAAGVRLIDTASAYGNEQEVGQAIREAIAEGIVRREEVFVTTKIYPGSEMQNPEQSIQACIDRLNIGYVDLMLLHHPDPNDVQAYQAMEQFVAEGKIRSIGLSNWYVEELTEFLPQVTITPALVQNEIHPYYQENEVIPFVQDKGIVMQGWYPLGGRGHTAELLGDPVISSIAEAYDVSSAQVILRWNLQKGVVVIPGSSNPDHIRENNELYHFELTQDEMNRINALERNEKHDWY